MSEQALSESDLPEISGDEKLNTQASKQDKPKKKSLKRVLFVLFFVLLLAAALAVFATFKIGGVIDRNYVESGKLEANQKLSPLEIQNISLNDAAPKQQSTSLFPKVDQAASQNLLSNAEVNSMPLIKQAETSMKDDSVDTMAESAVLNVEANKTSNIAPSPDEGLMTDLDVREKQTLERITSLEHSVQAMQRSIDQLNLQLSGHSKQVALNEQSLSELTKSVRSVKKQVKNTSYLVKKQQRKKLKKEVAETGPPKVSSFATWNGRDAVYVEYPKGKLTMLYEGDVVDSWKVASINPINHKVKFIKGKQTVTGGKK